jgi:hypothetical protein
MINNQFINVLSYFIKDIKSANERTFYKKIIDNGMIQISYKDTLIYIITPTYSYDYINNRVKNASLKYRGNYKICIWCSKCKYLYYKNDRKIYISNPNYIRFDFTYKIYTTYLKKLHFQYYLYLLSILKNINIL